MQFCGYEHVRRCVEPPHRSPVPFLHRHTLLCAETAPRDSPAAGVPSSQLQGYGAWREGESLRPGSAFRELCSKVWVSLVVARNGLEEEVPPIPISLLSKLLPLKNSLLSVDTHYDIDELKQHKTDCSFSTSFPSQTPKERKG